MKQTGRSGVGAGLYRGGWVLGGAALATICSTGAAFAQEETPSKASCAQAYESAQESRAAGQLQETQTRLSLCARPECPSFVQKDCARWLEEVDRELPSVVVSAPGLDAEAARQVSIEIDGKPVVDPLKGTALPLDPGRHELVALSPGRPIVSRVIMAQQGVQNRAITLDFSENTPAPALPAPEVVDRDGAVGGSVLRPYAYVAWGIGAVGLGTFAVLGTLGKADEASLKDDCGGVTLDEAYVVPGVCLKSDFEGRKDTYEREYLFADVGLVTGIVGLAAGTTLFILSATTGSGGSADAASDTQALRLDVEPTVGGAFASVEGAF